MLKKILLAAALSAAFVSPTALANNKGQTQQDMNITDFICSIKAVGDVITAHKVYDGESEKEVLIHQENYIKHLKTTIKEQDKTGTLKYVPKLVRKMLLPPKNVKELVNKAKFAGVPKEKFAEEFQKNSQTVCVQYLNKWTSED